MSVFDLFGREPKTKTEQEERQEFDRLNQAKNENKSPVIVFSPTEFRDVEKIIDALKIGKTCMVHLTELKTESALRVLDMLSGAVYAIGGGVYEMKKNIFMFSPSGVEVN